MKILVTGTALAGNLGYKPNTPIQQGVERFIKWHKAMFYKTQNKYKSIISVF